MLESWCFMNLKTAGNTISVLSILTSTLAIALCFVYLNPALNKNPNDTDQNAKFSIILTTAFFNLLVTGLLLLGIIKDSHLFIIPWLIVDGWTLLNLFRYTIVPNYMFLYDIVNFTLLCFKLYIFYGIFSLYHQIKLSNQQKCPSPHCIEVSFDSTC